MIETCQTNPNCEIKPSNCEYAVRCTTSEDLSKNKEVYVCGRNNCKEIMGGDKEMEKSKIVETVQELENKVSQLEHENELLKTENENIKKIIHGERQLNFDSPLDFAKSLIEHRAHIDEYKIKTDTLNYTVPEHDKVTFNYDDLAEIGYYLITYASFNKGNKR